MTDLNCSFCHKPRLRVEKLIAGNSGNICNSCLACGTEMKPRLQTQCVICEKETAMIGQTDSATGVCQKCANLSKDIFEKLSPGQTWIFRTNKTPRSCKRPYSHEERKSFYDSARRQLPKTQMTENTGDLLVDLLEIKPSKKLIGYARKWIHQFPNHEQAPDVLSFWLKQFSLERII